MSILGRTKPYRDPTTVNVYNCGRCGIERNRNGKQSSGYCNDCGTYARADGWTA